MYRGRLGVCFARGSTWQVTPAPRQDVVNVTIRAEGRHRSLAPRQRVVSSQAVKVPISLPDFVSSVCGWAGLHDNVLAAGDFLSQGQWQKVRLQFPRATRQPQNDALRSTSVTTSAGQASFWDSDSFNLKCHGRRLAPTECYREVNLILCWHPTDSTLAERAGSVWDVVVQPGHGEHRGLWKTKLEAAQSLRDHR